MRQILKKIIFSLFQWLFKSPYYVMQNGNKRIIYLEHDGRNTLQKVTVSFEKEITAQLLPLFEKLLAKLPEGEKVKIMDVGARGRGEVQKWQSLAKHAEFHSFEFSEATCAKMKADDEKDGINSAYYPYAVAGNIGERTIHVRKVSTGSSLFDNTNFDTFAKNRKIYSYGKTLDLADDFKIVEELKVKTVTLNHLKEQNIIPGIDFLKIDVEGAELEVLENADQLLDDVLGCHFEVDMIDRLNPKNKYWAIHKYMDEKGFEFYDLSRELNSGRLNSPLTFTAVNNGLEESTGQSYGADVLFLKKPGLLKGNQHHKLAAISMIYGQYEYALSLVGEILNENDLPGVKRAWDQLKSLKGSKQ